MYINDELNGALKNAFYIESSLVSRKSDENDGPGSRPNNHDWDEYLLFLGTNPEDPFELGGEVEFWVEDEKHIITKTTTVFIPAGTYHLPYYIRRVDRPFAFVTTGNTLRYRHLSYNMDPKWDKFIQYDDDEIGLPPIVKKAYWKEI
jgi:hypothetical protein